MQLRELERINDQLKEQENIERDKKARIKENLARDQYMKQGSSWKTIMGTSPGGVLPR